MQDKLAQIGLFLTGLLGLLGGLKGVNEGDGFMVGMSLFPAVLSFAVLLVMYFLSYSKFE